jgi:DNA polymerase-3 subunit gamma/tau
MLSQNAFNAFLKTLEEPPGHVKFIFATTDPHKVPATVLSRCQRHNFKLVALQKIVARLRQIADAEKFECADEALVLVARAGQGSMRDALSALEQVVASRGTKFTAPEAAEALGMLERGAVAELARALLGADAKAALEVVERVYAGGHDLRQLVEDLCAHLRNLCVARLEGAPGLLDLPDHDAKAVREQAAAADPAQLTRLLDLALQAAESVAESSQPRYALEVALLKAIHLAPTTSIPALVERLDRLASAPGAPPAFASASASAPAPAPASANVPAASAQPTDWRAVVDLIKAKKPRLAAHLTFARPVAIGAEIKIAFASNDIHADEVQKERATLEQILGRKLSIEITGAGAGAGAAGPSLAEEKEKRERDEREAKARGGREDPRIRGAADLLGGAIEDVRVIGGGED